MGIRKKLAKIMGIELVDTDGFLVDKKRSIELEWVFLRDFITPTSMRIEVWHPWLY